MAEQNNINPNHPNRYRPASEPAILLFLALPYLTPSVRPLAELCFHLLELQHLLKCKENTDFSSLFSGSIIADKNGLLSSLKNGCDEKYRPMFEMLANLSQVMQFYQTYQEMMPLLQSLGMGTDTQNGSFQEGMDFTQLLSFLSSLSGMMNSVSASDLSNTNLDTPASEDSSASYEDLLALLSPEQQEMYEQLRTLF